MEIPLNAPRRAELWLAAILLCASLILGGMLAHAMLTTSLSTDEFGTVGTYSSRGPVRVMTNYRAAKNHIFFNLVNSVLPGRESLNPARVRTVSVLAVALTALVILGYSARRGQLFEGTVIVSLWTLAPEMLTLSMEARGYGFTALFAVIAAGATIEAVRTQRRAWLATLAIACVLGVYTLPSFLILAAPLLLTVWLTLRSRDAFFAGALSGVAMLLLYAPVFSQLLNTFRSYENEQLEFGTIDCLWRTVRLYVVPCDNWQAALLLAALVLAPFALARFRLPGERLGLCLVAGVCAIYLATLVILRNPPLRVAACGLLPAEMVGILAVGMALRAPWARGVRAFAAVVITAGLLTATVRAISNFDFLPTENWTLAARAIEVAFPADTKIDYAKRAKYLGSILPGADRRAANYDHDLFANGGLIVADAGNKWVEGRSFHAPGDLDRVVEWTIPGRIRDIVLSFRKPKDQYLPLGWTVPEKTIPLEGLTLQLPPVQGSRALVLMLNRPASERVLKVAGSQSFLAGNAIVVPLNQDSGNPVELHLQPRASDLRITDTWISR